MGHYADEAIILFDQDYACSQSVLAPFSEKLGLKKELALKIANGFGGGIARRQEVCGAVAGAVMAIGLKYGMSEPGDKAAYQKTYDTVNAFCARFEEKYGTLLCREIVKCDMVTANETGITTTLCRQVVISAAQILMDLLEEE